MTMKTKKTLQHIAAVAVVLLTLCLVFAAPVSAAGVECSSDETCSHVAAIGEVHYDDLHDAMTSAESGETVELLRNVDLDETVWEPVSFKGKFNGHGYAISNLNISKPGVSNTGFITSLNGIFENVTFTNPTVIGGENTAVLAGRAGGGAAYAKDITVNGVIKVETTHSGYARAAVIVGGWAYGKYENIVVDGQDKEVSYVKHTGGGDGRYVAGIVGHADDVDSYTNCVVKHITISGGWLCGGIAGPGPADGTASGCSVEDVNINAGYSGGMFGWYYGDGTIEDSSVKDVTFTAGSTNNGAIGGYGENSDATVSNVIIENVKNKNDEPLLTPAVAQIGDVYYGTLAEAVAAAKAGDTITLLSDVTLTDNAIQISEGMDITIEGKGKNITSANKKDVFYVLGGKLVLGEGLDVYSPTDCAVYIRGGDVVTSANLKASGGYSPILGHQDYSGNVTINGGSVVGLVAGSVAIYWPQNGNLIVNDGIITGDTGIEIRAGTLTVNGGTISGTGSFDTRVTEEGNTVMGAGIAVSQFTTNHNTVVIINDGTISGEYALYEQNLTTTEKDVEALEKISLSIKGGILTGNIFSENEVNFITGGTFSFNPSAYIASGYEVVQPGDKYLVQKYVDRSSSSSSSKPVEEPEEPVEPEVPVEPETPTDEPVAGEPTVETEVTDGGEVPFETPAGDGGAAPADDEDTKITGVVLPTGTDSEVTFVPVSEQPAPAGQEENTKKVFEINVPTYEKGKPAVIKFTMTVEELAADGKEAADVALWHFDEETGEWTKLVTSYTIVDGVVYFEAITNDFSPFAIIYEEAPVDEPVEEPETPASPAPLFAVLAGLGAAVVIRRK